MLDRIFLAGPSSEAGGPFWLGGIRQSLSVNAPSDLKVDASGNIYAVADGIISGTSGNAWFGVVSNAPSTSMQRLVNYAGSDYALSVDTGMSGYYFGGYTNASGRNEMYVSKVDLSGFVVWSRRTNFTGANRIGSEVLCDSANFDDVFLIGYGPNPQAATQSRGLIFKYSSTGTLLARAYTPTVSASGIFYAGCINSFSGYLWACGEMAGGAGVVKYNLGLTQQWSKSILGLSGRKIANDSNDNTYVLCTNANGCYLVKLNGAGTSVWQRQMSVSGASSYQATGVAVDSSGNVFCSVNASNGATRVEAFLKYNSEGSLQWQRQLYDNTYSSYTSVTSIACSDTAVYVGGSVCAKLPTSGGLTGTYTLLGSSLTYEPSSWTDAPASIAVQDTGVLTGSTTLSSTTLSYTDSAGNSTLTTVTL